MTFPSFIPCICRFLLLSAPLFRHRVFTIYKHFTENQITLEWHHQTYYINAPSRMIHRHSNTRTHTHTRARKCVHIHSNEIHGARSTLMMPHTKYPDLYMFVYLHGF